MPYVGVKPAGISSASQVETDKLNVDNVQIDGNTVSSTDTNGNITLDPNGTGGVVVDAGHKLGVGTTPDRDLHVKGASGDPVHFKLEGDPADYARIMFDDGTDDNIGEIRYHFGDENLRFTVNASERMRITSDGKVAIGTSSASNSLHIEGNGARLVNSADSDALHLFEYDGSNNATAALYAANGDNNVKLHSSGDSFFTGRLAVGTNSVPNQFIVYRSAGDICNVRTGRTDSSNVGMIVFKDGDNQTCGQITSRGNDNTTSYNTSSDHRLKQSVTGMTGAIDRVKALLPKRFSFINDTTNTMHDGFLAHEAQTIVPQSVIGTHNETREVSNAVLLASGKLYAENVTQADWTANKGDDENDLYPSDSTWAASHTAPVYQQIDHSKLVPLLTGALQEAVAKIEALEARVTALEDA